MTPARLSLTTLAEARIQPMVDPSSVTPGIVHLGIGAFARGHTCVYTQEAMAASGDLRWGITAVTGRSKTVAQQLIPQDGLFTVRERSANQEDTVHVVAGIVEALSARDDTAVVLERIADPRTQIVTLTVTEKAYRTDPATAGLDLTDPDVRADLANPASGARTTVGLLARGIQARKSAGSGPLTVVCCDNLADNGRFTERLVRDFLTALPQDEGASTTDWLDRHVSFPSTMVDRMVPATTADDLDLTASELGLRDEAAIVCEPFKQWVIEDRFAGPRPAWEAAGAQFVHDVHPWESAKLRLLNASHTMLANLGLCFGMTTIAETVADPTLREAARRLIVEDTLPVLDLPPGLDGLAYASQIMQRYANPALGHTTAKVASDSSQKIPLRLVPTLQAVRATGQVPPWASLAVAAWMRHVATAPLGQLDDPMAATLTGLARSSRASTDLVQALIGVPEIFGTDLTDDHVLVEHVTSWYDLLAGQGRAGVAAALTRHDPQETP